MNSIVLSRARGIRSRVIDNLESAHNRLCQSCEASDIPKVITLTKFLIRLSRQLENELVQFVPEDDGDGRGNPPDSLDNLR